MVLLEPFDGFRFVSLVEVWSTLQLESGFFCSQGDNSVGNLVDWDKIHPSATRAWTQPGSSAPAIGWDAPSASIGWSSARQIASKSTWGASIPTISRSSTRCIASRAIRAPRLPPVSSATTLASFAFLKCKTPYRQFEDTRNSPVSSGVPIVLFFSTPFRAGLNFGRPCNRGYPRQRRATPVFRPLFPQHHRPNSPVLDKFFFRVEL